MRNIVVTDSVYEELNEYCSLVCDDMQSVAVKFIREGIKRRVVKHLRSMSQDELIAVVIGLLDRDSLPADEEPEWKEEADGIGGQGQPESEGE